MNWYGDGEHGDGMTRAQADDPRCVCGVPRSEHRLCGCDEGFVTPADWAAERALAERLAELEEALEEATWTGDLATDLAAYGEMLEALGIRRGEGGAA